MFSVRLFSLFVIGFAATIRNSVALKLGIKTSLDSRSANIHLSEIEQSECPFTVTYGACDSSISQWEAHHTISTVDRHGADRLVWVLPDDVSPDGCLSAWSVRQELVGRSEPLKVNKYGRRWTKKTELDRETKLNKRASIPMTNASGIDAQGPWFDGVELLKEKEIEPVSVREAKAKSNIDT
ncbi:MAG: hypothetical protein Q9190_005387 [Brigantiaea leucoxantha]